MTSHTVFFHFMLLSHRIHDDDKKDDDFKSFIAVADTYLFALS